VLDWMLILYHRLLEAESPKHLARFAGIGLADVEAWERFLFEDDWLNSFPNEEHCRRGTTRPAADY